MKNILIAFLNSPVKYDIPAYSFWEYYLTNGLRESGFNVISLPTIDWVYPVAYPDELSSKKWRELNWPNIYSAIESINKQKKIDYFITYFYPQHIDEHYICRIKKNGIKCINFFCDNVRQFNSIPEQYGCFDLNWVPEKKALHMYDKKGFNYLHLPMPMWVEPKHREVNLSTEEVDKVAFIGTKDILRGDFFGKAVNLGIQIHFYGVGWAKDVNSQTKLYKSRNSYFNVVDLIKNQSKFIELYGYSGFYNKIKNNFIAKRMSTHLIPEKLLNNPLTFDEYIYYTKKCKVILGFNQFPSINHLLSNPESYSRLRDIEAPMLGASYLTQWTEGLESMYEEGLEIEFYRDEFELEYKVKKMLGDRNHRNRIRIHGQKKALSEHSISSSINKIINYFS